MSPVVERLTLYVAIAVPFVLAYIAYVWKQMDSKKLTLSELSGPESDEMY